MAKKYSWLGQEDLDDSNDIDAVSIDIPEGQDDDNTWRPDARTIELLSELQTTRKSAIDKDAGGVYEYAILQAVNNVENPLDRIAVVSALSTSVYLPVKSVADEVITKLADIPESESNLIVAGYVAGTGKYSTLHQFYTVTECLAADDEYELPKALSDLIETIDNNPDVYSAISACSSELEPQDTDDMRPMPYYVFDKLIGFMGALVSARAQGVVDEDNDDDPFISNVNRLADNLTEDQIDSCRSKLLQMVKSIDVVAMFPAGSMPGTESIGDITSEEWKVIESKRSVSTWVTTELDKYHSAYAAGKYNDAYTAIRGLVDKVTPDTAITETAVILATLYRSDISRISSLQTSLAARCSDGMMRNIYRLPVYTKYEQSLNQDGNINYYVGRIKPQYTSRIPREVSDVLKKPIDVMTTSRIEDLCIYLESNESNMPYKDYRLASTVITLYTYYANAVNGKKLRPLTDITEELSADIYIRAIAVLRTMFPDAENKLGLESNESSKDIADGFMQYLMKAIGVESDDPENVDDDHDDDAPYTGMPELPAAIQTGSKMDNYATADPTGALYEDGSRRINGATVPLPESEEPDVDYVKSADEIDVATDNDGVITVKDKGDDTDQPATGDLGDDEIDKDYIDHYGNGDVKVVESRNPKDVLDETVDGFMKDFNEKEQEIESAESGDNTDSFDDEVDDVESSDPADNSDDLDGTSDPADGTGDGSESESGDDDIASDDDASSDDDLFNDDSESGGEEDDYSSSDDADGDDSGDTGDVDDIDATSDDGEGDDEGFDGTDLDGDGVDDSSTIASDESAVSDASNELSGTAGASSDNIVKLKAIEALRAIATESQLSPIAEKLAFDQVRHLANVEFSDDDNTVADVIMASQELIVDDLNENVDDMVGKTTAYMTAASTLSHNLYVRLAEIYNKISTLDLSTRVECTNGSVLNSLYSDSGIDIDGIKLAGLMAINTPLATTEQALLDLVGETTYLYSTILHRGSSDDILSHAVMHISSEAHAIITYEDIKQLAIYAGLFSKALNKSDYFSLFSKKLDWLVLDYKRAKERTSNPVELTEFHTRIVNYVEVIHAYISAHISIPLAVSKLPSRLSQIN